MKTAALHGTVIVQLDTDCSSQAFHQLTIMRPSYSDEDTGYHPPESITLYGSAIKQLLTFLREAYGE